MSGFWLSAAGLGLGFRVQGVGQVGVLVEGWGQGFPECRFKKAKCETAIS